MYDKYNALSRKQKKNDKEIYTNIFNLNKY